MLENQSRNKRHVLLTNRDAALLSLLYDHGMMSLGQVERYAFTGKAWPTILNRVKRLEEAGFLKRIRVNRLKHPVERKNVGVLLQLASLGLVEIAKLNPEKTFSEVLPDIRQAQLDHDLLLVDVIEKLKEKHPSARFMDGRRFIRGKFEVHRVPDAVMIEGEESKATAIELELTVKSEKRYRQIVLGYRLSPHFDQVLFVTASKGMIEKIQSEIAGFKVEGHSPLDTGKFSFKTIQDLFSEKRTAA